MPKKNKVKFNICNVHYALQTIGDNGDVSFGTPVPMPGAVSLSLDANGEPSNFYADGYAYYTISNNIPDSPEEWLDEFSTFSIYQILPKIIELWGLNVQTDVSSKKNFAQLTAK